MKISLLLVPLLVAFAPPAGAQDQTRLPMITSVEPLSARVGDEVSARGENLAADNVAGFYLTDGKTDIKVPILEQTASLIRFRIPPQAKSGRFALMVLTKGKDPKLVELPVKITIEEGGAT